MIRTLLRVQYGLRVGVGELAEIAHTAAGAGETEARAILRAVRSAPVVCGDETGGGRTG